MNTASLSNTPILPTGDYEFCLEDLELAFPKRQLKQITKEWNSGWDLNAIARNIKRDPDEVFLALFHQARREKLTRPFAYQVKKPITAYEKGNMFRPVAEIKKLKKGEPTVIEIDGRRFVYEPETKRK